MDTWKSTSGGGGGQDSLAVTVGRDRRACVWSRSLALLHRNGWTQPITIVPRYEE
jgi:hypothetical protein